MFLERMTVGILTRCGEGEEPLGKIAKEERTASMDKSHYYLSES